MYTLSTLFCLICPCVMNFLCFFYDCCIYTLAVQTTIQVHSPLVAIDLETKISFAGASMCLRTRACSPQTSVAVHFFLKAPEQWLK